MEELVSSEVAKASSFFKDVCEMVSSVETSLLKLTSKLEHGDLDTTKGLSLLELKCHLMVNYLTDLGVILMNKCRGAKLKGDSSVDRLVENRTVMEKMRPIEQKLKYHIEKLVKVASGVVGGGDPLGFRANPQNLVSKLDDGREVESVGYEKKKDDDKGEQKLYVPPKLVPVHYDDEFSAESKQKRQMDNARKRALNSSIIRELRSEYNEGPQEIVDSSYATRRRETHAAKHRREYEEDNLIRLNVTKRERGKERQLAFSTGLEGLANFRDISILSAEAGGVGFNSSRKRPRTDKKFNKGKKFKRGKKK